MIPEWILQIIGISVASTISGIILLYTHHKKVKQELKIHGKKEEFDRKQKVYRTMLRNVSELLDFVQNLGSSVNWRIGREIYNELILIGSPAVIDAHNNLTRTYDKATDAEATAMIKKLWIAVREDLYDETLKDEQVRFFRPSSSTTKAFEIYAKYAEKLKLLGIESYESLAEMNVEDTYSKTGISKGELESLKKCGVKELYLEQEWKKFVEDHSE